MTAPGTIRTDMEQKTAFYHREGWAFLIKPRNGCTSWDVWHLDPSSPAVAMGFENKDAAIEFLDRQVERALA